MKQGIFFDIGWIWREYPRGRSGGGRISLELAEWMYREKGGEVMFGYYDGKVGAFRQLEREDMGEFLRGFRRVVSGGRLVEKMRRFLRWMRPGRVMALEGVGVYFSPIMRSGGESEGFFEALRREKARWGFRVVMTMHDMIPVVLEGEFFSREEAEVYREYCREVGRVAEHVLCISESARGDVMKFWEGEGMKVKRVSRIGWGGDYGYKGEGKAVRGLEERGFILYVSAIVGRKNHRVLYEAYRSLVERGYKGLPKMVWVGAADSRSRRGLLREVAGDELVKDFIVVKEGVRDEELTWMYRHCLFTVFPSFYEGWGLPVGESLAHGKFCISSGGGALREVGGELVEYEDPRNVNGWAEAILRYVEAPEVVRARNERIREGYRGVSWEDACRRVWELIEEE